MLRTAWLLPLGGLLTLGFDPTVSRPSRQPATGLPGSYPDGTRTRWRRRAYVGSATQSAPPTLGTPARMARLPRWLGGPRPRILQCRRVRGASGRRASRRHRGCATRGCCSGRSPPGRASRRRPRTRGSQTLMARRPASASSATARSAWPAAGPATGKGDTATRSAVRPANARTATSTASGPSARSRRRSVAGPTISADRRPPRRPPFPARGFPTGRSTGSSPASTAR